ncbi:CP family cyanate transporter-like MFS transporter [Rhizobium azibense]|uniref:CP family cyanate transporter-like MFS transporter n=1 Tax=Rhizobium azibense TaxID=1136135 RepID=A0A4R3QYH8_9HYPH|nr:CP family cyanate transporter-like MFS transporter [Rhizobium azibense]
MTTSISNAAEALEAIDDPLIDAEANSVPAPQAPAQSTVASRVILGVSLVLIAFNLRPVFSSASALLPEIRAGLGLSALGASLLTTLPVVCLGAFSPLAPKLAQRLGAERTLLGVLVLLALGTAMRGLSSVPLLFLGTALAGACIAVGNVLLPGLVKRDFAERTALMTGCYTMALCAGAASAAGFTLPIEHSLDGSLEGALAAWALPAFIVAMIWLPQVLGASAQARRSGFRVEGLWRDRLAWQVTLFMGLQSALAYCVFGWLVPILRERGLDGVTAGAIVSASVMVQAAACLVAPQIAVRGKDQRLINASLCVVAVVALLGLLFAAFDGLALGSAAGNGTRRPDCSGNDNDRAAITRSSCRSSPIRHGAMHRLSAGRRRPPDRRTHSRRNRKLCLECRTLCSARTGSRDQRLECRTCAACQCAHDQDDVKVSPHLRITIS